jgi:hypothetical protein
MRANDPRGRMPRHGLNAGRMSPVAATTDPERCVGMGRVGGHVGTVSSTETSWAPAHCASFGMNPSRFPTVLRVVDDQEASAWGDRSSGSRKVHAVDGSPVRRQQVHRDAPDEARRREDRCKRGGNSRRRLAISESPSARSVATE